ncbi:MAG TPA: hypothetical protein VJL84_10940 [Kiloniellales bacterium]|nr:hypothetical protein [Kiloniellales bacterium]
MITRRALLLTGVAAAAASALAGCGSSEPPPAPAQLPSYAGKGETTAFDGAWIGEGYSLWHFTVQDGVFTGTGEGKGLSGWTGSMTGYIRKDHSIEGTAATSGNAAAKVDGTWPRLAVHWGSTPSFIRASRS